jgi:spore photoproduct lyase
MASFATKDVNKNLLRFDPKDKVRIRFSLMPEKLREILEPNTNTIEERLSVVEDFQDAGYEVHLNFSPVIVYDGWLEDYAELFRTVSAYARGRVWDDQSVKAEVIFPTHNEAKHDLNLLNKFPGEEYLWKPEIQEIKTSQFGGENIRYKAGLKAQFIKEWTELHDSIIPWNTIRYIF